MGVYYMRNDFVKFSNGKYAFTDEDGKIPLIECDRSEDFVYILLCKEDELEGLQRQNRMLMNTISRLRKNEKNRKIKKLGYIVIIPLSLILFMICKPISLITSLISSLTLIGGYKLFLNYTCGRKKDNKEKIDYANKKYNENRDRIPSLMDEIEILKKESNYNVIDRDKDDTSNKYSFKGYGINRNEDDVKIIHIARILSKEKLV